MLCLTKSNPTENMHRYYALSLQPTLFGGVDLVREYGRIGQGGTMRAASYDSARAAQAALEALAGIKIRRGYKPRFVLAV